jgi:hypothetical protein
MSTTKDKQIAQLSAQVAALTALVAKTIEQQQAPATKGKAKKAAAEPRAGNAWSAFSGALSKRVTALIKEGYADDARWESEKGAKDGCKRAGFQLRVAGLIKREYDLEDGEGGYLDPEDEQIIGAIEHLLDNPDEQSATAEARGGMSTAQLKAAGIKIAKPSAAKPVAKPVAKPTPVKKAAPVPEPEAESETEDEEEEAPAPVPAPVPAPKAAAAKKSPKAATKAAPKSAVLAAAAEVAEEVKEAEAPASALEEPTEDDLKEAGLVKFKNPNSKVWYLRTVEEPKRCYLGGPEKENIAKAWANFKAGICAGIWTKNEKGKLDICPVEGRA